MESKHDNKIKKKDEVKNEIIEVFHIRSCSLRLL